MEDVLRASLSFFLVVVGIGLGYAFFRVGQLLGGIATSVRRVTEEAVVLLSKAETTMDGVNLELARVDEIMQSAVGATKAAERTAGSVSRAAAVPARKLAGLAAGAREAVATFRARVAANKVAAQEAAGGAAGAAQPPPAPAPGGAETPTVGSAA